MGSRICEVLRHVGFEVSTRGYEKGGGLPRTVNAEAMIALVSASASPAQAFLDDLMRTADFPPVLVTMVGRKDKGNTNRVLRDIVEVDFTRTGSRVPTEGWKGLFYQLGGFFERPGLEELMSVLERNPLERTLGWANQHPGDPVAYRIAPSKRGAKTRAREFFRRLRVLIFGRKIPVWAIPAGGASALVAAAAALYPIWSAPNPSRSTLVSSAATVVQVQSTAPPDEEDLSGTLDSSTKLDGSPSDQLSEQSAPLATPDGQTQSTALKPGEFQDVLSSGAASPIMVRLPAGTFEMGSSPNETGHVKNEAPKHAVEISEPFAASKYEITESQFRMFLDATGASRGGQCEIYENVNWVRKDTKAYVDSLPGTKRPAVCISWEEASEYAQWLTTETGFRYRLMSEAEWEYAARANTQTAFSFGNAPVEGCGHMNGADKAAMRERPEMIGAYCDDGFAELAPVGSLESNGFGLHDMHGNAWEWTSDIWTNSHADDAWQSNARVMKGGSWFSYPLWLRSANRNSLEPHRRRMDVGFRVARILDSED